MQPGLRMLHGGTRVVLQRVMGRAVVVLGVGLVVSSGESVRAQTPPPAMPPDCMTASRLRQEGRFQEALAFQRLCNQARQAQARSGAAPAAAPAGNLSPAQAQFCALAQKLRAAGRNAEAARYQMLCPPAAPGA